MNDGNILKLMDAVPFSADELKLNKQGKFSEKQRKRIHSKIFSDMRSYIFIWLILYLSVLGAFLFIALFGSSFITFLIIIGISVTIALFVWGFVLLNFLKNDKGISEIEGEIDFDLIAVEDDYGRVQSAYRIIIAGLKFEVDEKVFFTLDKKKYKVYYCRTPQKTVLSFEFDWKN